MRGESLTKLGVAFDEWRATKRHVREPAPNELMARARAAVRAHGVSAVSRVTRVDRRRLEPSTLDAAKPAIESPPAFTRLELSAPAVAARPFAEVETKAGVTVRLFVPTTEALRLLSSALGMAGEWP